MEVTLTEKDLLNKTIKEIEVNGYGINLTTEDGMVLDYSASDGGYSCWEVNRL